MAKSYREVMLEMSACIKQVEPAFQLLYTQDGVMVISAQFPNTYLANKKNRKQIRITSISWVWLTGWALQAFWR